MDGPIHVSLPVDQAATAKKKKDHHELWGVGLPTGQRTVRKFETFVKTTTKRKATRNLKFRSVAGLSLLCTSKNISTEARPILYARNTFRFESPKAFYAFFECAHKAIAFMEDIEFVDIPDSSIVAGPLGHAKRLSRVSIAIKSNYIGRDPVNRISSWEIASLILECRCRVCAARWAAAARQSPDLAKPGEGCIAATYEMQRRRLDKVSVQVNSFEFQLTDNDDVRATAEVTDYAKQVKRRLALGLAQRIKNNVRHANGKPWGAD